MFAANMSDNYYEILESSSTSIFELNSTKVILTLVFVLIFVVAFVGKFKLKLSSAKFNLNSLLLSQEIF